MDLEETVGDVRRLGRHVFEGIGDALDAVEWFANELSTREACQVSTSHMSSDNAALVNPAYNWKLITADTPLGAKLLLINRNAGVLTHGTIGRLPTWFTHYCALPTFED